MGYRARRTGAGALLCGLAVATWWATPDPRTFGAAMAHPQDYVDRVGADRAALAAVTGMSWLVLGWLALGLTCCAAGALPGLGGRAARAVAARLVPATLRQAAAVVLGVSIATGGATAAGAAPAPGPGAVAVSAGGPGIGVDWPTVPGRSISAPAAPAGRAGSATQAVVVAPGQCLWDIAADRLGRDATDAQVAAEWQRWYATNRAVIGPDPDLIRPGQRLIAPEPNRSDRLEQR